jgi:DNA primase
MQDTAKYLVHADITADGVVERSDVVGAVFGQTEGLLGEELDLRELQDSSKVGRIDVEIDSQNGQSFGHITIATSLDRVETAILGAALETIDRVGPCRSTIEVRRIEDVRAAKRREVVERAKTLLTDSFDDSMRSSRDLVEEVRESVRVEDIVEYEGLPAGPRVADSDAIIVVEGRADVLTLLRYGIKNAIAVEGTDVPEAVASLSADRTVTAFLDGDRGGELILKEFAQVGEIDHVALVPEDRSVEELSRHEVMAALREKVPYERVERAETPAEAVDTSVSVGAADTGSGDPTPGEPARSGDPPTGTAPAPAGGDDASVAEADGATSGPVSDAGDDETTDDAGDGADAGESAADSGDGAADEDAGEPGPADGEADAAETDDSAGSAPETLRGHVRATIGEERETVRFLDAEASLIETAPVEDAFERLRDGAETPAAIVVDGELSQRILDVAAQRGVDQVVAAATGEFVKKPTSVRVRTADQLLAANEA